MTLAFVHRKVSFEKLFHVRAHENHVVLLTVADYSQEGYLAIPLLRNIELISIFHMFSNNVTTSIPNIVSLEAVLSIIKMISFTW